MLTDSSDEEHRFDIIQEIDELAEIPNEKQAVPEEGLETPPGVDKEELFAEMDRIKQAKMKKRKFKIAKKDGFEHLNIYENLITVAFKKSLESGNPDALKFMAV